MHMKLLGYREVDFISDKGVPVKGTNLYVAYDGDPKVMFGQEAAKLFVRDDMQLPTLTVGMTLNVIFNQKGRVVAVETVGGSSATVKN